jgi:CRISPR-associated endonuclease/helicase Cas3
VASWERLEWHLRRTGALARRFARAFDIGDCGAAAGLLHDIGKYSDGFQRRILENGGRVDHATPGAKVACEEYGRVIGLMLAFGIAGHHGGLPDGGGAEDRDLDSRLSSRLEPGYERWKVQGNRRIRLPDQQVIRNQISGKLAGADLARDAFPASFLIRMVFSCLVDADFLATEWFLDRKKGLSRTGPTTPQQLAPLLTKYLDYHYGASEHQGQIARTRTEIRQACQRKAASPQGFFTLAVPTGGGKTLSSLAFALGHATAHHLDRVIYAIPYTSIIEQTADVFRNALAGAGDVVVEHHSAADVTGASAADEPVGPMRLRLATENWAAPLIVTTTVQLFESLFSNRPSRCRKLHNLARSVIVLDEVQALPIDRLAPCLAALKELVARYRTTVLMCSATLPTFDRTARLSVQLPEVEAIVPDTTELRQVFNRVETRDAGRLDDTELATRLAEASQVLCVVDARKHAVDLFDLLPDDGNRFHLSAGMCPAHRREVLEVVKRRLVDGAPCRLIATRVIEAGVDIDFPCVWRSLAGIDSLAQAAGRCNRNGLLKTGEFLVFAPLRKDAIPKPLADLRRRRALAAETLAVHGKPLAPESVQDFFQRLFAVQAGQQDRDRCLARLSPPASIERIPFRSVAQDFRMIDDQSDTIWVPYDENARGLIGRLEHMLNSKDGVARLPLELLRKLQSYAVAVHGLDRLLAQGAVRRLDPDGRFHVLTGLATYDAATGVRMERVGLFDPNANLI